MNTPEIKQVPIGEVFPYLKNAKKHPVEQIKKIADSIREFGFNQPIVTDMDGVVIVGHGRLEAAKLLSLEKVPVLYIQIDKAKADAYRLADNKLNESDWDMSLVIDELKSLPSGLIDLTGFSRDLLIDDNEKDDVVPTNVPAVTQTGDIWFLGEHKLVCGDATSEGDIANLTQGQKADMIFTDPPYNVNYEGGGANTTNKIMNDNMSTQDFDAFLDKTFANYHTIIKAGGGMYVFHSHKSQQEFERAIEGAGFEIKNQLIWNKPSATMGMGDYRSKHEPFFYCTVKGEKVQFYGDRTHTSVWDMQDDDKKLAEWAKTQKKLESQGKSTIWTMKRDNVNEYIHPTQKPVDLIVYALSNSSKAGDLVVDLFGGSGSTLIACQKAGRICYTMELDPKYADTILERFYQYTGESPLRSDGESWEQLRGLPPIEKAEAHEL